MGEKHFNKSVMLPSFGYEW